jgi:cytochrome c
MHTRAAVLAMLIVVVIAVLHASSHTRAQPGDADAQRVAIDHGEYIVKHVAMCIYCHTPHNEDGTLNQEQLLQGAPMPVESPFDGQRWAFQAPKLSGLPGGWNEVELIRFLQTGETISGRAPLPPMPPFRMTERDASAVTAYLKSLP